MKSDTDDSGLVRMLVYRGIRKYTSSLDAKVPTANMAVFESSFLTLLIAFYAPDYLGMLAQRPTRFGCDVFILLFVAPVVINVHDVIIIVKFFNQKTHEFNVVLIFKIHSGLRDFFLLR